MIQTPSKPSIIEKTLRENPIDVDLPVIEKLSLVQYNFGMSTEFVKVNKAEGRRSQKFDSSNQFATDPLFNGFGTFEVARCQK